MYQLEIKEPWMIFHFEGNITMPNSDSLKNSIKKDINDKKLKQCIFSFRNLDFLDSTGIGVIISISKYMTEKEGEFYLTEPHGIVEKVIEMTKIKEIIPIYPSINDLIEKK